jgi:predicted amidohydrolase YtcJ
MLTLLYNAKIHTLDPARPFASAIAIDRERILAIGDDATLISELGDRTDPIDLGGRTIIPGLIDAHLHLQHYALGLQKVDCETTTKNECLQRVAERARAIPAGEWVLGHGWNQNEWPEGFGDAAELDSVAPDNPVYLTAKSLHATWTNSVAMRMAGIGMKTEDPSGGRIGRDAEGRPTGILFETAMELISKQIPVPSPEGIAAAIKTAQYGLWRMGLTCVHDFDQRGCFAALQILHAESGLNLRVVKSIPIEDLPHAAGIGLRTGFGDDFLRIGSVKAFADGALGPRTAAMFQPYEGEPDNRGILLLDGEELFERGRLAVENGLSLAVHAIGDRANHEVLDAYEQLRKLEWGGTSDGRIQQTRGSLRHRIEHVQIIHPDDIPRLAALDVIASMQPIHAPSDYPAADRYWGERAINAYAWRTILNTGARMAFGSDAPVESPNPFWGIHAAVARRRQNGSPGPEGWYPEQRIGLDEAMLGFTRGPAYAAGVEDRLGRIAPGYLADLLILDKDIFTCEVERIYSIRPLATMVGGKWVYADDSIAGLISSGENPPLES